MSKAQHRKPAAAEPLPESHYVGNDLLRVLGDSHVASKLPVYLLENPTTGHNERTTKAFVMLFTSFAPGRYWVYTTRKDEQVYGMPGGTQVSKKTHLPPWVLATTGFKKITGQFLPNGKHHMIRWSDDKNNVYVYYRYVASTMIQATSLGNSLVWVDTTATQYFDRYLKIALDMCRSIAQHE